MIFATYNQITHALCTDLAMTSFDNVSIRLDHNTQSDVLSQSFQVVEIGAKFCGLPSNSHAQRSTVQLQLASDDDMPPGIFI